MQDYRESRDDENTSKIANFERLYNKFIFENDLFPEELRIHHDKLKWENKKTIVLGISVRRQIIIYFIILLL